MSKDLSRRRFFRTAAGSLAVLASGCGNEPQSPEVPSFLHEQAELYRRDSRPAALEWFKNAQLGLSVRYGVYSQLGRGENVQFNDAILPADYAKLKQTFAPEAFDAGRIADLAMDAGARYINFDVRSPDGFCLFRTNTTAFCSLNSPARRDLTREMTDACAARGLGLFLAYSYALDWRHPYFYPRQSAGLAWPYARPDYEEPPPRYKLERDEDFLYYIQYAHQQLEEILYRYTPLAGLWLYPVMGYYSRPDLLPIPHTYELIRTAQPSALICFEQGANGEEDFTAHPDAPGPNPVGGSVAAAAWVMNHDKPLEIAKPLQRKGWGYDRRLDGKHHTAADVADMLEKAETHQANLLLNTGLLPDGAVHPEDERTLLKAAQSSNAGG